MDLVFETTKKFEEDINKFEKKAKDEIIANLNFICSGLLVMF